MKFEIEFDSQEDFDLFEEYMCLRYMEVRRTGNLYGIKTDIKLSDIIMNFIRQLHEQEESHDRN